MHKPRATGLTLRRIEDALHQPHDAGERMDPDFPIAMRCSKCGKVGYGPRKHAREAMREHMESHCSARHTKPDEPQVTRYVFPRI